MLSSVLHSKRAIQVNVIIMRTFVRLRQMLSSNEELAHKLAALEKQYDVHGCTNVAMIWTSMSD